MARYISKFETSSGSISYTWPTNQYELELSQGLRTPSDEAIGLDYSVRLIGTATALKQVAKARVRFTMVSGEGGLDLDTERDSLLYKLHAIGFGKLYTSDGRWAWASLSDMPSYSMRVRDPRLIPVILTFDIWSNWMGTVHDVTTAISSDGQEFEIVNDGLLPVTQMVITITPSSSSGYNEPVVTNLENGFVWESARVASATTQYLRLDTNIRASGPGNLRSTDSGATYADDFANYVLPANTQKILTFQLEPGSNTIRVNDTGTPNHSIRFYYNDAWP